MQQKPYFKLILCVEPACSGQALAQLYKALEFHDYSDYQLTILDVTKHRQIAEDLGAKAIPSVILVREDRNLVVSELTDVAAIRETFGFRS